MKALHSWLLFGTVAFLTATNPALAQTPPSLGLRLFAGVSITGTVGSVYVVQSSSDLTQGNAWTSLAFLQLPATNYLFVDTSGPAQGNRFYRALLQTSPTTWCSYHRTRFDWAAPQTKRAAQPTKARRQP